MSKVHAETNGEIGTRTITIVTRLHTGTPEGNHSKHRVLQEPESFLPSLPPKDLKHADAAIKIFVLTLNYSSAIYSSQDLESPRCRATTNWIKKHGTHTYKKYDLTTKIQLYCLQKMHETGDRHVEQSKPSSERQISHFYSYMESRPKKIYDMIVKKKVGLLGE
jgi:hypothetical protein